MLRSLRAGLFCSFLYFLAFPKPNVSFLGWFALLPVLYHLLAKPTANAFWPGFIAGTGTCLGVGYWLIPTFQVAGVSIFIAVFCLCLLSAYIGLYWGLWSWIVAQIPMEGRWGIAWPWIAAAAWVASEYLRGLTMIGLPWTYLGYTQASFAPVLQFSSLTGVYGISFLLAAFSAVIACRLTVYRDDLSTGIRRLNGLLLAALVGFVWIYGRSRLASFNEKKDMSVALLQGSIDQYRKWDQAYVQDIEDTYGRLAKEAATQHPALILWPETAVPGFIGDGSSVHNWLMGVIKESGTDHIVGAPIQRGTELRNAAVAITKTGQFTGAYDKQQLVPIGEWNPLPAFLERWVPVLNALGGTSPGTLSPVLPIAGTNVAVNICYEAIFPNLVRKSVKRGGELIANLTNDGWYLQTAAPYQHFLHNIFRAVENDRWLIRADNTGISAVINPRGRVTVSSKIFVPTVIFGSVEPRSALTLYTRWGDWFPRLCVLISILSLLLVKRPWYTRSS